MHIQFDIGKSFGSLIAIISLANFVINTKYDDTTAIILSLFQLAFNVVIGLLYWKHESSMLSITRSVCLISLVIAPIILMLGIFSGKPLNVNLPFYENSIDSTAGKLSLMAIFCLWTIAIYVIFSSKKAAKEFASVK